MPAATPLIVLDTWVWSTPSPSIRLPVTGWVQPIRATTAQPWDTKKDYRRDHAETTFNLPFRVAKIDARDPGANCRGRFSGLGDILHAHHAGVTICVENTMSEMGDPSYLRAFVDETRLSGLRFNFDIGHAHLSDFPEGERLDKSFSPLRDLVSSVHLHDNHGEKDEHLPPYDGTIDWPAAIKLLKTAPESNLPLVLELKEKTGPEAPSAAEQLTTARKSMDRFEKAWN